MTDTIIIQSHKPDPGQFEKRCVERTRAWAESAGHEYLCIEDELFDLLPDGVIEAAHGRMQMAADIARLIWIQNLLDDGWARVVWIDADVLIFRPDLMMIDVPEGYAFGHEDWVQPDRNSKPRIHRNVHNAILIFTPSGRVTLDFYLQTATSMLSRAGPNVPPQFVGPKLLSALHNVVGFPLTHAVGMASPLVLRDLASGGGRALDMLMAARGGDIAALNLCASLVGSTVDGVTVTEALMTDAMAFLDQRG